MVHILLLILKIIGIILGILLAILLIGICLALFVPVRYQVEARRTEEEGAPPIEVKGSVTWLLHFVNIHFRYPADIYLRARLMLFTVFRLPPKQKNGGRKNSESSKKGGKRQSGERNKKNEENRKDGGSQSDGEEEMRRREDGREKEAQSSRKAEEESVLRGGDMPEQEEAGKTMASEEEVTAENSQKLSITEKIRAVFRQIQKIFQNIWYTLTGICDKIKMIWENIEYYMGVLKSETFQKAFLLCKEELFSILSYIRPRKFQADLAIGMDDPAATGKILSYYGMLYPFIGGHVNIVPDFERKRIEGAVLIKGKIRMFTFIKAAVRLYFSKDIRKLLRLFKKEDV